MNGCLSCGAQNAEGVLYCVKCGKRLEPPAPPPEYWRYSDDLNRTQVNQAGGQPTYQPPPAYQNYPPQPPQQVQPIYAPASPYQPQYPAPPAAPQSSATGSLPQAGMTMGIVVACIMVLGLIPCLGWLNYFTILFGKVTIILCIVALVTEKNPSRHSSAIIGLVLASVALVIGFIRLVIGGGCL
ncbi:MAG TPA: hypothetical protein VEX60_03890 [Pyrinomonadaceae bacterium]|nr:hypothetical protein [Pyrinomonadaceae bacterium]